MKKFLLIAALGLFGVVSAQKTDGAFKLGAHVGIPVGDASKGSSFNLGADLAYTWRIAENFDLGITTGYTHFFGKSVTDTTYDLLGNPHTTSTSKLDLGFIPLAATGQYNFKGGVFIGADLGYAFATGKYDKGGFYYQPKVGYTFQGKHDLYVSYKGISDKIKDTDVSWNIGSVNLGYAYKF